MDVVCFSFDCTFNDDGSSNCNTTDPKYSKTTTHTPTTQQSQLPTSHRTATPLTSISTQSTPEPKPSPRKPSTTTVPTERPTSPHQSSQKPTGVTTLEPKPSPGKPSSTQVSTGKPTPSHQSSQKPSVVPTRSRLNITTVTLPHILTTPVSVTTTANNSRLPDPPKPQKVTSYPPIDSADGKSIYIPCSVVGCVVVFLIVSIGVIRWHRNRRRSSEERQLLHPEWDIIDISDTQMVQPTTLQANGDPMFSDVPSANDISDTEENEVERIDLLHFSSGDSDDLEMSPKVIIDEVIFDASTERQKQRKHGGNTSGDV